MAEFELPPEQRFSSNFKHAFKIRWSHEFPVRRKRVCRKILTHLRYQDLKSLGPIDRKFHGHGKNDGFVLYEYIIKQCSSFCKYTNISVMKKKFKENNISTVNRKYVMLMGNT